MTILETILSISTALFGGVNILQLLTFRAFKRKANGEATQIETENLKTTLKQTVESYEQVIEMQQEQINSIDDRLKKIEKLLCYRTECEKRI